MATSSAARLRRAGSTPAADRRLAFAFLITRLGRIHDQLVEQVVQVHGLGNAEATVLVALALVDDDHGLTPSAITRMLVQTSGGTSAALRRLEARGLISRDPDPDDARGKRVRLSGDGPALAQTLLRDIDALHADLLAPITAEQARALIDALQVLLAQLERRSGHRRTADVLGTLTGGIR